MNGADRGVALAGLALAFAIGVGGFHLLTEPLDWTWFLAPALVLLMAWLAWGRGGRGRVLGLAAGCLAGIAWAQFQACLILCHPFPEADVRTDLVVEGRIASLPTPKGLAQRFLFRIDSTRRGETDIGFTGLARLSWYRDAPPLVAGERWRLRVRLKPPHGYANPGGFDYERWLFEQGVTATGTVREGPGNLRLDPGPGPYWLDRLRQGLREHIRGVLGDSPASGLVQALALGERSAISQDQWEVLRRTGTNHLIAISGLHVGLVAGLAFLVGRRLWALSARLTLVLAAPRAAALSALAAALAYSALAGFLDLHSARLGHVGGIPDRPLLGTYTASLRGPGAGIGGCAGAGPTVGAVLWALAVLRCGSPPDLCPGLPPLGLGRRPGCW